MYNYSINNLREWLKQNKHSALVVLTDDNTSKYCLPKIEEFLTPGYIHINIPSGEHSKSLESASLIWNKLLENNIDRNALLINLGGGMITDLGGFCAATYKRGISFINIPTTLMGMVDAAIGGKTGINIDGYKNQVGAFAEAKEVFIDPLFLTTLPGRELVSGFAEVLKYGLIYDLAFARKLLKIHPLKVEDWLPLIQKCVRIKDQIVNKDPKEHGLRKILNFGHTIGHAIESYSLEHDEKPLLHGEAVALGLIAELFLSSKKTEIEFHDADDIADPIVSIWHNIPFPKCNNNELIAYMLNDKKNANGEIRFALLKSLGDAVYDINCPAEEITEALDYCRGRMETKHFTLEYAGIVSMPEILSGIVELPTSKSISNRVLIIEALEGSRFMIENLSDADDTVLMKSLYQTAGNELYVKNAGTVARFLLAYFASHPCDVILKGDARMNRRPVSGLVNALKDLGADIQYMEKEDFLPVHIQGTHLKGGYISMPANVSSQFISALLLIAPTLENGLSIELIGEVVSEPYIGLTLKVMSYFGIEHKIAENLITVPAQKYIPKPILIESDWSSASYFWALAALMPGSELEFDNLWEDSWQGDSVVKEIMKKFYIESSFENGKCRIKSWAFALDHFSYDFIDCPDLAPTYICLCCALQIPFDINGIKTLRYKESDRAEKLKNELAKLGYKIDLEENSMKFDGLRYQVSKYTIIEKDMDEMIVLNAHDDHRLAMSFFLLALKNPNVRIAGCSSVKKSFPKFWTELEKLGFKLTKETRSFTATLKLISHNLTSFYPDFSSEYSNGMRIIGMNENKIMDVQSKPI